MHTEQGDVRASAEGDVERDEVESGHAPARHAGLGSTASARSDREDLDGTYGVQLPARSGTRSRRIAWPAALTATALAIGLVAFAALDGPPPSGSPDDPPATGRPSPGAPAVGAGEQEVAGDPFESRTLYVDGDVPAGRQAEEWRSYRPGDAAIMDRLADQPAAAWFGRDTGEVSRDVDRYVSAATAAGDLPVLVAYNIPERDCGQFSDGGAASPDAYRRWIADVAAGIGDREAVVILEPDALAHLSCLSTGDQMTRLALLTSAVATLEDQPGVAVYIDAGNPAWIPVEEMAELLGMVGINRAEGFALNVSSHHATDISVAFAKELSARLGGKGAVIDTSRNGAGSNGEWCNPSGRALGPLPTTDTGEPAVDALLWVKTPGESDGTCNGGPPAGSWWPEYALDLAVRAGF